MAASILFCVFFFSRIYVLLHIKFLDVSFFSIIQGFVSDLVFAILIYLFANLRRSKIWQNIIYIIFIILSILNASHALVNYSNINVIFIKYALTGSFLFGSVLSLRTLIDFCSIMILSGLLGFLLNRYKAFSVVLENIREKKIISLSICFFLMAGLFYTRQYTGIPVIDWIHKNFIEENIENVFKALNENVKNQDKISYDKNEYQRLKHQLYKLDLGNEKIFSFNDYGAKHNILLVLVEGLSASLIGSDEMPYLSSLAAQNIYYTNFISQQKQTNRGLYAVLCGNYPNLMRFDAKADYVSINNQKITSALPYILSKNGYTTVFMQGAILDFMYKDKFSKNVGFDEWLGSNSYSKEYERNGWGIDDKTLFTEVLKKIDLLSSHQKPWFLTVLTLSAHHPYFISGRNNVSKEELLKYMDENLQDFMAGLKEKGVLKDTLVLILSDESSFMRTNSFNPFEANHGPLIVLAPENKKSIVINDFFAQSDLETSILDYLGILDMNGMGRSIFRKYDQGRELFFGNIYQKKCYYLNTQENRIIEFSMLSKDYTAYSYDKDKSFLEGQYHRNDNVNANKVNAIRKIITENDIKPDYYSVNITDTVYQDTKLIISNHPISVKKGEVWQWIVNCTAKDEAIAIELLIREPLIKENNVNNMGGVNILFDETTDIQKNKKGEIILKKEFTKDMDLWTNVFVFTAKNKSYLVNKVSIRKLG